MGSTKKKQYNQNQLQKARIAKALGHPARVTIMEYLALNGFVQNRELPYLLHLSGATIVQHLHELESVGLIAEQFIGNKHYYFIYPGAREKCEELVDIFDPVKRG